MFTPTLELLSCQVTNEFKQTQKSMKVDGIISSSCHCLWNRRCRNQWEFHSNPDSINLPFFFFSRDSLFGKRKNVKLSLNVSWPETDLDKKRPRSKTKPKRSLPLFGVLYLGDCYMGFSLDDVLRLFEWFWGERTLSPFGERESRTRWLILIPNTTCLCLTRNQRPFSACDPIDWKSQETKCRWRSSCNK